LRQGLGHEELVELFLEFFFGVYSARMRFLIGTQKRAFDQCQFVIIHKLVVRTPDAIAHTLLAREPHILVGHVVEFVLGLCFRFVLAFKDAVEFIFGFHKLVATERFELSRTSRFE